jgi:hypothetical protein
MKSIPTVLLITFLLVLLSIAPILLIWALNTLFPSLAIDSSFENYLAAWVLICIFKISTTSTTSGK